MTRKYEEPFAVTPEKIRATARQVISHVAVKTMRSSVTMADAQELQSEALSATKAYLHHNMAFDLDAMEAHEVLEIVSELLAAGYAMAILDHEDRIKRQAVIPPASEKF